MERGSREAVKERGLDKPESKNQNTSESHADFVMLKAYHNQW